MKKLLAVLLAAVMALSLAACGDSSSTSANTDNVDVDLTALSSTMVYSEVNNMVNNSTSDYIGKVVKMTGTFGAYYDEANDYDYYACVIQDATACCAQGLEFVLGDNAKYPDDYPAVDEEVTIVGVFNTYELGGVTYPRLENAKIV